MDLLMFYHLRMDEEKVSSVELLSAHVLKFQFSQSSGRLKRLSTVPSFISPRALLLNQKFML